MTETKIKKLLRVLRFLFWIPEMEKPIKTEYCQVCSRELTDRNRGSVDKELCFQCEHDRAIEEGLEEW